MNNFVQCYYRAPWNRERVDFLQEWWPHWGTMRCAEILNLKRSQIKAKADKLKLRLLPKSERICADCKIDNQSCRGYGLRCKKCHGTRRRILRREKYYSDWMSAQCRTIRSRHKKRFRFESDLTLKDLTTIWDNQQGLCYYSGLAMITPDGTGVRHPMSASLDRINPEFGYVKGNVVWSLWAVNAGKNTLSRDEYLNICRCVATKYKSLNNEI